MILAFLVSFQWALVTYWLSLDHYLLVGKCVRLLLDGSITWTTTIAQHSSRILDSLGLSYPASSSEFTLLICLYYSHSSLIDTLLIDNSIHRHTHNMSKYPNDCHSAVNQGSPVHMHIGDVYKLSHVGQLFW